VAGEGAQVDGKGFGINGQRLPIDRTTSILYYCISYLIQ
jgi:hypothetical protein